MQEMEEGEMNPDQMVQGMQGHMPSAVMQSQMQQQHVQQLHRFWYLPITDFRTTRSLSTIFSH
jgi:hypothetical protein